MVAVVGGGGKRLAGFTVGLEYATEKNENKKQPWPDMGR